MGVGPVTRGFGGRMALDACLECGHEIPAEGKHCPRCGAKVPNNFFFVGGVLAGVALGAVLLGWIFSGAGIAPGGVEPAAKIDNDVGPASQFAIDHPSLLPNVTALIAARGYKCPIIVDLWHEGQSGAGEHLEALCGPDKMHIDANLHYAVYPDRGAVNLCKPWQVFGPDCE